MDINEKVEKQIIANYIYKNDLCIRRLVKKKIYKRIFRKYKCF